MKKKFDISVHVTFKDYKDEEARKRRSISDGDQIFSEEKLKNIFEILNDLDIKYFNTWLHSSIYTDFSGEKKLVNVLKEYLKKYPKIKVSSLHYNGSIFELEESLNEKIKIQMKNYVELVKDLKSRNIVVHPGVFGEGGFAKNLPNYNKAIEILGVEKVNERVVENIRYFGKIANSYGIKIAVENIFQGRIYSKIPDLINLVNEVNLENVGFCFDVGHGNYDKVNICDTIRKMKDKLFELHLSDNLGDRDAHFPIGFGNVNWIEIIETLWEIDYNGVATFEFFRWPIEDRKKGIQLAIYMWENLEKIAKGNYSTLDYL